jgi:preprotein translocase subunit SecB
MVKLIKLNSQDLLDINAKARFSCQFQEDIILKPYSKIALRNIQFTPSDKDYFVTDKSFEVSLKTNLNGSLNNKLVTLPNQDYGGLFDIVGTITNKLNSAFVTTDCPLIRTGIYNRVMFKCDFDDLLKVYIDFKFIEDNYNTNLTTSTNIEYDDTNQTYTKTGNNNVWDFIGSGNIPICGGTGTLNFVSQSTGGLLIGVSEISNSKDIDDLDLAVFTDNTSGFYQYQIKGQAPITTLNPIVAGDKMELVIEEGLFKFKITRGTGTVILTNISKTFVSETSYYAYFGIKYLNAEFSNITWTQNPFVVSDENGIRYVPTTHIIQSALSDATPSDVNITFLNDTNRFLGFEKINYKITGVSGSFVADKSSVNINLPDGFYVVIENIRLNSYDYNIRDKSGRRKNILANITNYNFSTTYNLITYETDYPIYIDIDNKEPIFINYITISIYDQSNEIVDLGILNQSLINSNPDFYAPVKLTLLID